jgi:RNA polymerase sigma factor for flagellar operon FliA
MTPAEVAYKSSAVSTTSEDDLVLQELPQVYYIAARIRERLPQHVELEDLVSAGVVGLIEATRNFDSSKNVHFKTFAKFRIRGAIFDSLRETDWGSRYMRRRAREIAEATTRLEARLGRHPAETEVALEMEMDPEQLRKIIAQLDSLQITGQRVSASHDRSEMFDLIESAPDLDAPDALERCLEGERKAHLTEAIGKLSEREQLILSLYYREELTLKEIAKVVGVSLSRVSQIREEVMTKLRILLEQIEARQLPAPPVRGGYFEHI